MIYVDARKLDALMRRALSTYEVDPVSIDHVVGSLVQTSCAADSHGINLFPHYCRAVKSGLINGRLNPRIDQTAASTSIVDADNAFGHHAGARHRPREERAAETGIAAAAVHTPATSARGRIACAPPSKTASDSHERRRARQGTQQHGAFLWHEPICCCAPMADEGLFSLDMAISFANWRHDARRADDALAMGRDIRPTVTDASAARSLAPLGGYKASASE